MSFCLPIEVVLGINKMLGSQHSVINMSSLESAVSRPTTTTFDMVVFDTWTERAAVLLESIARYHPFSDGNKRTAWLSAHTLLEAHGMTFDANTPSTWPMFVVDVATRKIELSEAVAWIRGNLAPGWEPQDRC